MTLDDKYCLIDKIGNHLCNFIYDELNAFCDKRALVMKGDKYGFIDNKGVEIIPCQCFAVV